MITDAVIKKTMEMVEENLRRYARNASETIKADPEKTVTVNMPVKFTDIGGNLVIDAGISFATGKVKDKKQSIMDEKQIGLFKDGE